MKNKISLLCFIYIFLNIANAQEYSINILSDSKSSELLSLIKSETKSLFPSSDKIKFNIKTCQKDCEKILSKSNFVLLNKDIKLKKIKDINIITYNHIQTLYDKNRVVRASALSIYEYLKENKKENSLYIKNEVISFEIEEKNSENDLTLKDLFLLTLSNNFNVKQNLNSLKIGELNIDESKTYYKPKIDVYSNLIQIDSDRARYSSGLYSKGTFDVGIKIEQLIYSNRVLQNIKIKRLLDKSNISSVKAKNDEILYKVVLTYLNILKANKYSEIMKIKENFINQNLEFAKQRLEIGYKDRSDVYKWESEFAKVNIDLANAQKELNYLKIELSNLLQIEKDFSFKSYSMKSLEFKILDEEAIKYLSNRRVQEYILDEIISSNFQLKQIDSLIKAKSEEFKMNKSSKYLPTIAFQSEARNIVSRYGQGANSARAWDDNEYQALINLNLSLYEGGAKNINIQKNEIELINLRLQYNDIKNLIKKSIEQNYSSFEKSYEKILYAKKSYIFSKKNLELIQDKYNNGKENIITLLDAQNSYIISKLNENISMIDYLIDLSSIYYFSGNIEVLENKIKKEKLEQNILKAMK